MSTSTPTPTFSHCHDASSKRMYSAICFRCHVYYRRPAVTFRVPVTQSASLRRSKVRKRGKADVLSKIEHLEQGYLKKLFRRLGVPESTGVRRFTGRAMARVLAGWVVALN